MARRFESFYKSKRNDNYGDPDFWNRRFDDLDLRLHERELDSDRIADAVDGLISVGLQRMNDTFTPVINEAIDRLQSVGAQFLASSDTEEAIDADPKTFVLGADMRASYVVTDYVAIRPADHTDRGVIAQVTAYDRETGLLDVQPVLVIGSGNYDDWLIRPTPAPDLEHATRVDNPHATTAAQVGAYTTAQTDTAISAAITPAIATAINNLVASSPAALNTLNELAAALGNDANFATTMTNALANKQPLDADLTAIAALVTTAFGRGILTWADAAAGRTALSVQPTFNPAFTGTATASALKVATGAPGNFGTVQSQGSHAYEGYSSTVGGSCYLARVDLTTTRYALFQFGASTQTGSISTDTANTAYNTTSDVRVKYDIRLASFADSIDRINVRAFKRSDDGIKGREHVGFIAQELHQVVPYAVMAGDANPDARPGDADFVLWQVDQSKLVPMLIAAVQDLRKRVSELEAIR